MDSCLWYSPKIPHRQWRWFANIAFLEVADHLGITVHTAAGESPWSNGVVERNNQTLTHIMDNHSWNKHLHISGSDSSIECKKQPSECCWFLTIPTSSLYQSQITSHPIRWSTCTISKTIITDSSRKPKCHTQCTCCIRCLWEFWDN